MTRLGDVATYINGFAFKPDDWSEEGLPIIRIQDLTGNSYQMNRYAGDYNPKYEVNRGDVLISWSASLGVYVWQGEKALLNQHIFKVVFDKCEVDRSFYVHQVAAILEKAASQAHGATMKHLTKPVFDALPFYLPDLPTQQRIADTLDKVSEGIGLCRKMLGELDLMVKAKFVEMFGDAKVNPFDWVQSTIGASCTLKSGTSLPLEKENEGGNIPYVKVGDMNYVGNEKYITTSSRFVTEETAGVGIFPVGSVVFPKRGGAIGTNKKRLTSVPICADLNVMGVIPGKQLLPQYLLAYFDTIDLGLLNNGSSVPQINNKDIAPLIISIPPIELQEQFATFVSKIDKSRLTIQQVLSKMELEQKVLMQECFGRHVALNILS